MRHFIIPTVLACTMAAAGLAWAQSTPSSSVSDTPTASAPASQPAAAPTTAPAAAPTAAILTIRDIYDRMQAAGYRDLREIEFDDGRYEVKASNAQGQGVKLYVNAQTGAVERSRLKNHTNHH